MHKFEKDYFQKIFNINPCYKLEWGFIEYYPRVACAGIIIEEVGVAVDILEGCIVKKQYKHFYIATRIEKPNGFALKINDDYVIEDYELDIHFADLIKTYSNIDLELAMV